MAPSPSPKSLLNSSATSLSFLVALQLFSRLFTSILNQVLFRLASPSVFGTAAIQFELVLSTILFLSREGVRGASLRSREGGGGGKSGSGVGKPGVGTNGGGSSSTDIKNEDTNNDNDELRIKQLNLTFLPILLGVPLALATSVVYLKYASEEVRRQPRLTSAVVLYAVAALVELGSEPGHNRAMLELKTQLRVRAEGLGITAKSLITLLVLYLDARGGKEGDWALVAFALGQLGYAVVVFGVYTRVFGVPVLRKKKSGYFDRTLLNLSMTMTGQSVIKHVLTEGDKLMLTFFSPLKDQGGYAIAANYGSLLARIVFQPLEETLRVFFSRLLSSSSSPSQESLLQASTALSTLLTLQLSVSVLFVIFGSAYLNVLLPLILPQRYLATSAPRVLEAWVWYIPVLAVNGGVEAFLASVASPGDLNRQSRWMFGFSVIYVSTAMMLYKLGFGDVSLIYANSVNLVARISYCLVFASRFFASRDIKKGSPGLFNLRSLVPPLPFLLASGVAAVLVRVSAGRLGVEEMLKSAGKYAVFQKNVALHIGVGAGLGVVCVGVWWVTAGRKVVRSIRKNSSSSSEKIE